MVQFMAFYECINFDKVVKSRISFLSVIPA